MADSFKSEPDVVKSEVKSESGSPAPFMDDDLYEDAGDLDFYDQNGPADLNHLALMRVSKDLWKNWSEMSDDQEIQIGTMRVWDEPVQVGKEFKNVTRRKILLNHNIPQHQEVPREYDLSSNNRFDMAGSHFVFAEEDLPGFKEKSRSNGLPLAVLRARSERVDKPKPQRNRNEPYFRKAIPKKTKLIGRLAQELTLAPVAAEQHKYLMKRQIDDENRGGKISIISNKMGQAIRNETTMGGDWDNLVKTQPKPSKAKKVEMKTTRIPENELMDKIFQCFAKFQYWSLKSLRAQLQQPEAYLRQTLEKIAILNKSGRFANNWSLKPENVSASHRNAGDVAPEEMGEGATDIEDDDNEVKMEDAL